MQQLDALVRDAHLAQRLKATRREQAQCVAPASLPQALAKARTAFTRCCTELTKKTKACIDTCTALGEGLAQAAQGVGLHPQDRMVLTRLAEAFLTLAHGETEIDLPCAQAYAPARQGQTDPAQAAPWIHSAAGPQADTVLNEIVRQTKQAPDR